MKKKIDYYFWVFIPLLMVFSFINSAYFAVALLTYALIYRPFIDWLRLYHLKEVSKQDAWKFFIPFYSSKYLKTLFFGNPQ